MNPCRELSLGPVALLRCPRFFQAIVILVAALVASGPPSLSALDLGGGGAGEVSRTNRWSLNDLVRELPPISPSRDRGLRRLSAIQEGLYLHERRMRGEGLPAALQAAFEANYEAVVEAMVEDRLPMAEGREYLSIHRQLLARTDRWLASRLRDEGFVGELLANLDHFGREMRDRALSPSQVPQTVRTPLLNGYQVWLAELVAWGEESGTLNPGARTRIQAAARRVELFEGYCKANGELTLRERELLHARLVDLTRETMRLVAR